MSRVIDPVEILDYQFDWTSWLGNDTITGHTVTAETGVSVVSSSELNGVVTTWLSNGILGHTPAVECTVETAAGRTAKRSFTLVVETR